MPSAAKRSSSETETVYSRADLAAMLNVTPGNFDRVWKPLIPLKYTRREGRRLWYLPAAVRALIDAKVAQVHDEHAEKPANGAEVPLLDPLKAIKVEEARLKLFEQSKRLISTEQAMEIFGEVAEHIRIGLATLEERFGRDATRLIEQQLDRAGKALESGIHESDRD